MALTPIGTGAGEIDIETFNAGLAEITVDFLHKKSKNLWKIIIVCNDKAWVDALIVKFKTKISSIDSLPHK